nr:bifunctional aminoglycoside phosphotransferase/ATP-binding protein [Nitrosomonas nitrosa]
MIKPDVDLAEIQQKCLIEGLRDPTRYPHPVKNIQHVETHISHLLLTGEFAYKFKKPLNLGFLDFSALEKRRFYCEEELRLNRRLAPDVYLEVVSINGEVSSPSLNGAGPVLDYAVKMRQFDPESTLDRLEEQAGLLLRHVDMIADKLADFHSRIPLVPDELPWGRAETLLQPVTQNFEQMATLVDGDDEMIALLTGLRHWSEAEHTRLATDFECRRAQGFVRECHGDLHLGNMAWHGETLLIFDCIEFNPALRWIDVVSEVAFCYMDLLHRNHDDLACRFLNNYLSRTGDYAGVKLLRYYVVYRAMVRAKVAFIRANQSDLSPSSVAQERQQGIGYLHLAKRFCQPEKVKLVITHGLSGSGKTTFGQQLIMQLGLVMLRSDIERKRLAGLDALARSGSTLEGGIYTRDFSRSTYQYLGELTGVLLNAGWSVLVDATFIAHWQRSLFQQIAVRCGAAFYILDFSVPESVLRQRVQARSTAGRDASEADRAVLEQQLKTQEPLLPDELSFVVEAMTLQSVVAQLKTVDDYPSESKA